MKLKKLDYNMPYSSLNEKRSLVHTYQTREYGATIGLDTNGRKTLEIASRAYFYTDLDKFTVGEKLTLNLTNKRPKRTVQQNRYYWGVYLPLIAEKTGEHNLERLNELFKGLFLTNEIVEVLGKPVRMKKSTTSLSVLEFSEFIEKIHAETGVEPPPVENFL